MTKLGFITKLVPIHLDGNQKCYCSCLTVNYRSTQSYKCAVEKAFKYQVK